MSVCTPKSFDLTGKVALITGASYGIGFAIATAMANCGATIVFNDIKQELVDKGLAAYKEAGIEAHGYVCDVTNEDAVNEMVKKITAEVGHINVLVNNAGWHCEPITAIQPERITRGPAAGTWADTKAADMQECLYEALAPYAGKSVLQAIGEQHGLGFLMADGTLTVAQASVISGTDSDPRFEQYYALLPEKQPDVILYDDAEVRDMAEFHAWIEQHFTITDRYTVQHGTASLQVLVVG